MKNNKALFTIFLIAFIDLLGFGLILPLLPFIGEKFGANPFLIGLLTATYSFFQFISAPILGALSDRFGRKKLLIISQLGSAAGYLMLGFSNTLPLLFLSRVIDGVTGGNISITQAYIADVTTKENRAKGMGIIGAAFGLGFIFGPMVGGVLYQFGYAAPAIFATVIAVISAIATQLFLKETVDTKAVTPKAIKRTFSIKQLTEILTTYPIGLLIITFFIINTAFSIMQGNFALWTERTFHYGPTQNGWLLSYVGVIAVIVQLRILPFFVKKFSEKQTLLFASVMLSIALFLLAIINHPYLIWIALTLLPLGSGLSNPTISSLASENVPPEEYGETLGILHSAASLGRILGPIMGGWLFFTFGKNIPFHLAGLMMLGVIVYLKLKLK
jgi:MFS transporter, DHA1 family, tetracycline resistance protein